MSAYNFGVVSVTSRNFTRGRGSRP